MKRLVMVACCISLLGGISFAKEGKRTEQKVNQSDGQTGLGFNSQLSGPTGLAIRYWGANSVGIEGIFGFSSGNDTRFINVGGKILGTIKKEANARVYGFGLVGICNSKITWDDGEESQTDVVVGTGLGVEFFLSGLPNLGFGVEAGIGYDGTTETFGTQGNMTNVGIRYYF